VTTYCPRARAGRHGANAVLREKKLLRTEDSLVSNKITAGSLNAENLSSRSNCRQNVRSLEDEPHLGNRSVKLPVLRAFRTFLLGRVPAFEADGHSSISPPDNFFQQNLMGVLSSGSTLNCIFPGLFFPGRHSDRCSARNSLSSDKEDD